MAANKKNDSLSLALTVNSRTLGMKDKQNSAEDIELSETRWIGFSTSSEDADFKWI